MLSGGEKSSTMTATSAPCATAMGIGVSGLLENQKRPCAKRNHKLPRTGLPEGLIDATCAGRRGSSRNAATSNGTFSTSNLSSHRVGASSTVVSLPAGMTAVSQKQLSDPDRNGHGRTAGC